MYQLPCETKLCVQSRLALDSNLGSAPRIALESEKPFAMFVCVSTFNFKRFFVTDVRSHPSQISWQDPSQNKRKDPSQSLWPDPSQISQQDLPRICDGSHLTSDTNRIQTENINL